MDFVNKLINSIGMRNIIIGIAAIVAILVILFLYRIIKLKIYRKELVDLENQMHAVKSLPLQYRLGRVQSIGKNMPEVAAEYDRFAAEFDRIYAMQSDTLVLAIQVLDDALFARRLRGVKVQLAELSKQVETYENDAQKLLKEMEEITEIENIQRLEIIRVKELYRTVQDVFSKIRFKVEDFVPALIEKFDSVDASFVQLETYMNGQKFAEANALTNQLNEEIKEMEGSLSQLPTYISIVRKYIPKRLKEIAAVMDEMEEEGFSLDVLKAPVRFGKIEQDLTNTVNNIKSLELESVGTSVEVMTEEINALVADFEKEQVALNRYQEHRMLCYRTVDDLDIAMKEAIRIYEELSSNYIMDMYPINIEEDYQQFQTILEELKEITALINSKSFSYTNMIDKFDSLMDACKPYEKAVQKFNEIKDSVRIEEKRALDELDNINIVLLEIKSEIKNKHLPMINDSYKDYIDDSYKKASEILNFTKRRPVNLELLSKQVDAARDVIYKLYDNVHNLIVTAEMVEDAIIFGNRYRSVFVEVNTELTKAELLFRNGEYTKALTTAVEIIEKIKPGSYEMLVKNNKRKV